jgi:hypothetical protein
MSDMTGFESYNEICTIRIELLETEPLIWREVEVPTSVTLKVLHDIIQITVGWFDCHLRRFTVGGQSFGPLTRLEPRRGNIHGTEQRHKTSGPLVLDRPRRPATLASPPTAAMILRLCLNEMVLKSGEHQLSLCQRQPDGPGRILVNPRAAADHVNADGPIGPGHLHHDPPLHPTPRSPNRPTLDERRGSGHPQLHSQASLPSIS